MHDIIDMMNQILVKLDEVPIGKINLLDKRKKIHHPCICRNKLVIKIKYPKHKKKEIDTLFTKYMERYEDFRSTITF